MGSPPEARQQFGHWAWEALACLNFLCICSWLQVPTPSFQGANAGFRRGSHDLCSCPPPPRCVPEWLNPAADPSVAPTAVPPVAPTAVQPAAAALRPSSPSTEIFIITPTSTSRPAHRADMTRLANTLAHIRNLHWVVVEDAEKPGEEVGTFLRRSGVDFTHLATAEDPTKRKGRGMGQRNVGMNWVRQRFKGREKDVDAVVYFADDDNSYDRRLFDDFLRKVRNVGMWPNAFHCGAWLTEAILDERGKVGGFYFPCHDTTRVFAVDMASFAIHVSTLLKNPDAAFGRNRRGKRCKGKFESCFLEQLEGFQVSDLEVFGHGPGQDVLVWHTQTVQNYEKHFEGGKRGYVV